jgi:C1A family cysteine protease
MSHKYGYKRGLPDHRDHKYAFSGAPSSLPPAFSLAQWDSIVFDQGQLGSCTANAISGALKTWMVKNNYKWPYTPSRLEIYYQERAIEGTINQDAGAIIRDGFKVINSLGVCPEDETSDWNWPYDISKYTDAPPVRSMADAALHKCLTYSSVNQDQASIQGALVAGFPLVIGIAVFNGIESQQCAKTGIIPMPGMFDAPIGGHALRVSSYDENYVSGPNSWGKSWGDKGYYHLPWSYVLNPDLCSDIWKVGLIT